MVENRVGLPKAPVEERIVSSFVFPLQHLQVCLEQIEAGEIFEVESLDNFRKSNRVCRNINIAVSAFSGIIASRMLWTKTDGFRAKVLIKVGGLIALAHASHQAVGALDKTRRQLVLDSLSRVSSKDFL